jgi:hypothetical protein
LDTVCADVTGSNIPACVEVDGDGDGETSDNDLTSNQESQLASAFRDFIVEHRGQDISANGLVINNYRNSVETDNVNMFRAVSQFVGTARGGWSDATYSLTVGTAQAFKEGGVLASSDYPAWTNRAGRDGVATKMSMYFRPYHDDLRGPSNISRAIIHETLHREAPLPGTFREILFNMFGGHERLDARARQLNVSYGLGMCGSSGGIPACGN